MFSPISIFCLKKNLWSVLQSVSPLLKDIGVSLSCYYKNNRVYNYFLVQLARLHFQDGIIELIKLQPEEKPEISLEEINSALERNKLTIQSFNPLYSSFAIGYESYISVEKVLLKVFRTF